MKVDAELDKKMANFDFSNGKPVSEVPALKAYQERHKNSDMFISLFDEDVKKIVLQHDDPKEITRLNAVIRALYA